ncbi:class II aaRS and biotin synthetase [Pseudovirgaria hyperparasitica]|uniref:Class II aaRS and biotin synthetase n=1 Tax=Pseudovirgaria hyperparasitica TaxID=470096 RepID=A0A6A6W6P6_9PEZI|nr:class II aaRS and biotin synthetase [Pseudovirgaria hyperparasitica]KAF2758558.1 class II aaRS and biotin synthetase [Pseudovirgaria hyperparasitica]
MSGYHLPLLYPFLQASCRPVVPKHYSRVYRCAKHQSCSTPVDIPAHHGIGNKNWIASKVHNHDRDRRVDQLRKHGDLSTFYPRQTKLLSDIPEYHSFKRHGQTPSGTSIRSAQCHLNSTNDPVEQNQGEREEVHQCLGRVTGVRRHGSKLAFVTIERKHRSIQATFEFNRLESNGVTLDEFKSFAKVVRIGDWYCITGTAFEKNEQVELMATSLPTCLAPSLHQIPEDLKDPEKLARYPHVKALMNPFQNDVLYLRSLIQHEIRSYLQNMNFMEVETPILEGRPGGANARAFETRVNAQRIYDTNLKLRIAPELSLKRLIVAGNDAVFEIGKVFRNEGIDATHNPEFTICEFYETGADLQRLMSRTVELLQRIQNAARSLEERSNRMRPKHFDFGQGVEHRFSVIDFVPILERETGRTLPDHQYPNFWTFSRTNIWYLSVKSLRGSGIPRNAFPPLRNQATTRNQGVSAPTAQSCISNARR